MSLACTKFLKENDRSVWGRIADRMCMRVKLNKRIMIQDSASTEMWSTVLFYLAGNSDEIS